MHDEYVAPEVRAARTVRVPAAVVWAAATDVRRHAAWIPLTRIDAPAHLQTGASFTAVSGPGVTRGLPGLADTMVVERLDPPDDAARSTGVAVFRKTGPLLLGTAEVHVRPLGPQVCQVAWVERVHVRGPRALRAWSAVSARLVGPPLRLMVALALRRMAAELEG